MALQVLHRRPLAEIHPQLNNVCFLDVATGKRFLTKSTMKSQRKEKIDGVEYHMVVRDVTTVSEVIRSIYSL